MLQEAIRSLAALTPLVQRWKEAAQQVEPIVERVVNALEATHEGAVAECAEFVSNLTEDEKTHAHPVHIGMLLGSRMSHQGQPTECS